MIKNASIKSVVVLTVICLIVASLLALTNYITSPIINEAEVQKAKEAMMEILPLAEDFNSIELNSEFDSCIVEAYSTSNNVGYIFKMNVKGFNPDMIILCGINDDGTIAGTTVLSHSESQGYGSKTTEKEYSDQYIGKTNSIIYSDIDAISGATYSSTAYFNAIKSALNAYTQIVNGGSN